MSKIERKFSGDRILKDILSSFIETELEIYILEIDDQVKKESQLWV
ncbi:hypothetical protein [Neobacillus sp. DY30]|nr:hypothetical protein [Neobacillus sp. DY30]WHY01360.1 hypothetical protein QNH29_03655 [Neobacillus sp. DY30]